MAYGDVALQFEIVRVLVGELFRDTHALFVDLKGFGFAQGLSHATDFIVTGTEVPLPLRVVRLAGSEHAGQRLTGTVGR